jgi:hypothetical protein
MPTLFIRNSYEGIYSSYPHPTKFLIYLHAAMVEKYYIGGQVEILSSDLAAYMATIPPEKRAALSVPHEDIPIWKLCA